MKKFLALFIVFCGFLVLLPSNVFADVTNEFKCTNTRDSDGLVVKNCTFKAYMTGNGRFNHTEGRFVINNMDIVSISASSGFILDFNKSSNYLKLTSNHVYTSNEGEVVYASLIAKQANYNVRECNIGYEPVKTGQEETNNFTITKEAYQDDLKIKEVKIGEEFQYRITVTSKDNVLPTDNVVVTDVIPEYLEIVSAGEGIVNNQEITWNLGSFPAGVHSKVLTVNVKAVKETNELVKNTAVLKVGDNTFKDDETTKVVYSNINITKKASRDKIGSEEEFYYILTVENVGTGASEEVIVSDVIDESLTVIGATPEYTNEGNTYYFNIGSLKAKEAKTIRINVKAPIVEENKTIFNVATATEKGKDPVRDEATVEIITEDIKPDISIKKDVNKTRVKIGEEFNYSITVTNNNTLNLTDVLVKDIIDSDLEILECVGGLVSNNIITWAFDLKSNEKKVLTIRVKVKDTKKEKIVNQAVITYENKETPSNEVEITITKDKDPDKPSNPTKPDTPPNNEPDIENPKTGSIISYIILSGFMAFSILIYWYVKTKKKFYRL